MVKVAKPRLDQVLVDRGIVESRARAQALIMAGKVYSETPRLYKGGLSGFADLPPATKGQGHPSGPRRRLTPAKGVGHFG
ncbi:MAG: TlyA family rRNA (cytidine-2'-O)-methyltransferase, partial [Rhodospirillaceae bacterium]|nr:TlyA family rRNA (cytidine-2'-O)-methyltransferase [Rhodospirillaceae bacterium]